MAEYFSGGLLNNGYLSNNNNFGLENSNSFEYQTNLDKFSFVGDPDNKSIKIYDTKKQIVGHYSLSSFVSFFLTDNIIIINTMDEKSIVYVFVTSADAEFANNLLNDLINV